MPLNSVSKEVAKDVDNGQRFKRRSQPPTCQLLTKFR
ncbi:MAG: hypothetical protein RLZZ292_942 [Bacteroidota bacterium]|jgi:hypothetical protein